MNKRNDKQASRPKTPKTKKLIIIRGRGTPREERIVTDIDLYWSNSLQRWVTIP
jgi:hypothetical protein